MVKEIATKTVIATVLKGMRKGSGEMVKIKQGILPIGNVASHNYSCDARQVRDSFKNYFNSAAGAVSRQNERVQRTVDPFDRR